MERQQNEPKVELEYVNPSAVMSTLYVYHSKRMRRVSSVERRYEPLFEEFKNLVIFKKRKYVNYGTRNQCCFFDNNLSLAPFKENLVEDHDDEMRW